MSLGNERLRLGIFASHGGSNLQAIIDAAVSGVIDAEVALVISNNSSSGALQKARQSGITALHISSVTHPGGEEEALLAALDEHEVNLVLLAGYMKKLGTKILSRFSGRILNIHPALLPRYGGQGMFGSKVHEAVIRSRETTTGVTIHLADEEYDRGPIVAQVEVPVEPADTPESLGARVLQHEHRLYVETLKKISTGEIDLSSFRSRD